MSPAERPLTCHLHEIVGFLPRPSQRDREAAEPRQHGTDSSSEIPPQAIHCIPAEGRVAVLGLVRITATRFRSRQIGSFAPIALVMRQQSGAIEATVALV